MYSLLLITHLIGLSISAGTSVYLGALSRYAQRHLDQTEAKTLMPGISGAVSAVGNIGLAILLLSGLAMAFIIGFSGLTTVFWVKMTLVAAIIGYVGVMNYWAAKVRRGKPDYARRMKKLAVIGAPLGLFTIAAAVVAFH
jgi:uncharacterized membrane protein